MARVLGRALLRDTGMAVPVEIVDSLNELARDYRARFLQSVKAVLARDKFRASGKTLESIKTRVELGTPNRPPQVVMEYDEAGEFISKRRLIFTKQPPWQEILDTVKTGKFRMKSVPGYDSSTPGIPLEKQQKRIAFAIARHKLKEQSHKRLNWRRPALSDMLRAMNRDLIELWAKGSAELIADSLSTYHQRTPR